MGTEALVGGAVAVEVVHKLLGQGVGGEVFVLMVLPLQRISLLSPEQEARTITKTINNKQ